MMLQEFIDRTGLTPTAEEYQQIEMMYYEAGNMDKDEFCKDFMNHAQSTILATFYKQAEQLKKKCNTFREENNKMVDFLLERAQAFSDMQLLEKAIQMIGHAEVIRRKIALEHPLWNIDKEYIKENIK